MAQIQFWWAIFELAKLKSSWTLVDFLIVVSMPLLLFIAAALVLPHEPRERDLDLRASFARDGRLALLALALFNAVACIADYKWWPLQPRLADVLVMATLIALPLSVLLSRRSVVQLGLTVAYACLLDVAQIVDSPAAYG